MDKQQMLLDHYSSDWSCRKYSDIGLWKPEEVLVREYIPSGSKVLEVGCGGGRATIPLKKMGYDITGIDIVPKMIELSRKNACEYNADIRFSVMDASDLSFDDSSFDAVLFLYNGIESVPGEEKRTQVLKEVHRVLKKSGVFLLVTQSVFNRTMAGVYLKKIMNLLAKGLTWGKFPVFKHYNNLALGEKVVWIDGRPSTVLKVTNPVKMINRLKGIGFDLEYINSRDRIEQGKKGTLLSSRTDRTLYYVLKKR